MRVLPCLVFLSFGFLAHPCCAVLFSTTNVAGSTCLHMLDTAKPFRFDTGQAAEMVMSSVVMQVTRRGVRCVSCHSVWCC